MGQFKLEDYEPVSARLPKFYEKYNDGRVLTEIAHHSNDYSFVVFKATLYANGTDERPLATGYAFEKAGDGYVNKTSHIENCETSAIGRALANIGMHGGLRPSREEMEKATRNQAPSQEQSDALDAYVTRVAEIKAIGGDMGALIKDAKEVLSELDHKRLIKIINGG